MIEGLLRTSGRTLPLAAVALIAACSGQYMPSDEFTRPTPGSYFLVETGPDASDAIMMGVSNLLAREPRFRALSLSNGLESMSLYSFKFRGPCAAQRDLVDAVKVEVAKVTAAPVRCVDRR